MRARVIVIVIAVIAGCGDNIKLESDAGPDPAICGNSVLETGEACDDGDTTTDLMCDSMCRFTCGNGEVDSSFGEICDPGIAAGSTGACPTSCDDGMSCTADVMSGSGCAVSCVHADITVAADDDGCCPPTENALTDNDCAAVCGNAVQEPGELCDTGIPSGAGSCPASCNDGQLCTTDLLVGTACQATCTFTAITLPMDNDMCCPPGATPATDNDCQPDCGNGMVQPLLGETCDIGIPSGPGSCPTACSDGVACTSDVLLNPGTCTAACQFNPIVNPADNDGCCPAPAANETNDNDCAPVCGNSVIETGEECDPPGATCSATCQDVVVPTAFRFSDLDLRDPHAYTSVIFCIDITSNLNTELQNNIQADGDGDGELDLSPVLVFRPLDQGATATSPLEVHFADCTSPMATTACTASTTPPTLATATNQTVGNCLGALTGTLSSQHTPAPTASSPPCFASGAVDVTIDLSGIIITLRDARVGATYVGNPATSLTNGLLRGFITQTDANNTTIPASVPFVGGDMLSSVLPGGSGNCASHDARDTHPVHGIGWWFYLNFPATNRPWTD